MQVGPDVGEAEVDDQRGDPLLGEPSPLPGQLLWAGWEGDALGGQRLADGPLGLAELLGERGEAVAGVAACLQVAAQVGEPELAGAPLQPPDTTVVDHKPALDDQSVGRFCW